MSDRILAYADRAIRIAWVCVAVCALGMLARGGAAALEAWKAWP